MKENLKMFNNSYYGNFRNRKFTDIFGKVEDFSAEYKASPLYVTNNKISDASISVLYYLLYSNYGNSTIASDDENQFKFQLFTTIFEYGPA